MNRRNFLATGLGTVVASAAAGGETAATKPVSEAVPAGGANSTAVHPRDIKLWVKPVMTNISPLGRVAGAVPVGFGQTGDRRRPTPAGPSPRGRSN